MTRDCSGEAVICCSFRRRRRHLCPRKGIGLIRRQATPSPIGDGSSATLSERVAPKGRALLLRSSARDCSGEAVTSCSFCRRRRHLHPRKGISLIRRQAPPSPIGEGFLATLSERVAPKGAPRLPLLFADILPAPPGGRNCTEAKRVSTQDSSGRTEKSRRATFGGRSPRGVKWISKTNQQNKRRSPRAVKQYFNSK